jgi:hypothetical protein
MIIHCNASFNQKRKKEDFRLCEKEGSDGEAASKITTSYRGRLASGWCYPFQEWLK